MQWVPLESNPDVMNKYVRRLGLLPTWGFTDVLGIDEDLQALVPKPVIALLLLYPLSKNVKSENIGEISLKEKCFFVKQTISNSCGTIAILHALANNDAVLELDKMPWLKKFIENARNNSPAERATILENEQELSSMHEECANVGQTEAPDAASKLSLHFVTFVNCDGKLLELDGRREGPVLHGRTTADTFLPDCCAIVNRFIQRDPDNVNFNLIALSKLDGA